MSSPLQLMTLQYIACIHRVRHTVHLRRRNLPHVSGEPSRRGWRTRWADPSESNQRSEWLRRSRPSWAWNATMQTPPSRSARAPSRLSRLVLPRSSPAAAAGASGREAGGTNGCRDGSEWLRNRPSWTFPLDWEIRGKGTETCSSEPIKETNRMELPEKVQSIRGFTIEELTLRGESRRPCLGTVSGFWGFEIWRRGMEEESRGRLTERFWFLFFHGELKLGKKNEKGKRKSESRQAFEFERSVAVSDDGGGCWHGRGKVSQSPRRPIRNSRVEDKLGKKVEKIVKEKE